MSDKRECMYINPHVGECMLRNCDCKVIEEAYTPTMEEDVVGYMNNKENPAATKSEGGPSSYYDFPEGFVTLNDIMEFKATQAWKEHSLHLKDVGKAMFRFGTKEGTSRVYDAKKIVYSGLRLLMMLSDRQAVNLFLHELISDPQFRSKK